MICHVILIVYMVYMYMYKQTLSLVCVATTHYNPHHCICWSQKLEDINCCYAVLLGIQLCLVDYNFTSNMHRLTIGWSANISL